MKTEYIKNKNGFGLLEIVVSVAMILITAVPLMNLFNTATKGERQIEDKLKAVYLAEEGVEAIRKMRDDGAWPNLSPVPSGASPYAIVVKNSGSCTGADDVASGFRLVSYNTANSGRVATGGTGRGYIQCPGGPGGVWLDSGFRRSVEIAYVDYNGAVNVDYMRITVKVYQQAVLLYTLVTYLNNLD